MTDKEKLIVLLKEMSLTEYSIPIYSCHLRLENDQILLDAPKTIDWIPFILKIVESDYIQRKEWEIRDKWLNDLYSKRKSYSEMTSEERRMNRKLPS